MTSRLLALRLSAPGNTTILQRVLGILRSPGITGHLYSPNVSNYLLSDGSTGLTTVDGVTGLVLDGIGTLGADLISNGGFSSGDSGWFVSGGWTAVSGFATSNAGLLGGISQGCAEIGKYEVLEFDAVINSGWCVASIGGAGNLSLSSSGRYKLFATAGNSFIRFDTQVDGHSCSIDNVSCKDVAGIPAMQPTTASKPVLKLTGGRYWWDFDGADDALTRTFPAGYDSATVINAAPGGQVTLTGQNIVGAYPITADTYGQIIVKDSASLSAGQLAVLQAYANSLAGV